MSETFLRRFWSLAYRPEDVLSFLQSLPLRLKTAIDRRLHELESVYAQVLRCGLLQGGAEGSGDPVCTFVRRQVDVAEPRAWGDGGCCFLAADFGAVAPPLVTYNSIAASLLGLPPPPPEDTAGSHLSFDETSARVAEMDLLRLLLADLQCYPWPADDGAPRYFRLISRRDGVVRATLVFCAEQRSYDGCGRLMRVNGTRAGERIRPPGTGAGNRRWKFRSIERTDRRR